MEFGLLGPVEVWSDGRPVAIGGPRQRALLALLLIEPGATVAPARLIDELWDGRPPAGAESSLRSYVSRLRGTLGAGLVAGGRTGYRLAVCTADVDARRFEQMLREGREALAAGGEEIAAERLASALALWRGPALADVAANGALATEARRLDELRLACLEDRLEADLALGRHTVLVPELQVLVEQHPLRERLRRLLMLALYRAERQADALEAARVARRVLDSELGLEPSDELRELELAILRHDVEPVAAQAPRHNLPAEASSFVGRAGDIADVARLLREHRLVTITGLGGAGKTRLALEIARSCEGEWKDGVWLVDLTAVADPRLVAAATARTVGAEQATLDSLLARSRALEALVVLDNCEHLVEGCAELTAALLRGCPRMRVLATSRSSLGSPGEVDYALPPLPEHEAVQLFAERAAAVRRGLRRDEATMLTICRELDGLPLAIELAAARAKALSPAEIAARLDDRFRFLRAWHRVADPRHRTLETTMDWSYELLAEEERALLRCLSVFAGGADLDAVAAVCLEGDELAAIDLLTRLVDASLVRVETGPPSRYRLLETVRQYAASKLDEVAIGRRHAEYFLDVAEASHLALPSPETLPAQHHAPVLREQHNLRAAIDWAMEHDVELALRLMLALENFWSTHVLEWRDRFERLLPLVDGVDVRLRARAMLDYGSALDVGQDTVAAEAAYGRSRELFEAAGDDRGVAYLDYRLGIAALMLREDVETVRRLWERSLETFRRLGDETAELQVLGDLGFLEIRWGDRARGRAMARRSIDTARRVGWHWWVCQHTLKQARVACERGEVDEADALAREGLPVAALIGNRPFQLLGLAVLARVAACRGETDRALALWSSVAAVEDMPGRFGAFDRPEYAAAMPQATLPEPLRLDDAVALALGD